MTAAGGTGGAAPAKGCVVGDFDAFSGFLLACAAGLMVWGLIAAGMLF